MKYRVSPISILINLSIPVVKSFAGQDSGFYGRKAAFLFWEEPATHY